MTALTSIQKAIVVLLSMGPDTAPEVFRRLNDREIKKIANSVSDFSQLTITDISEVYEQFKEQVEGATAFLASGQEFIQGAIENALGSLKAQHLLRGVSGQKERIFESVAEIDNFALANLIRKEHPQTKALILSYLPPEKAAGVLSQLTEEEQSDILRRIAKIESIRPEIILEIEEALLNEVLQAGTMATTQAGGVQMAVDVLNSLDRATEGRIMDELDEQDEDLATEIREKLFIFENLLALDNKALQLILREVDTDTLLKALKTASEPLREKIYANISKRAAQILMEDLSALGPVRVSDIEKAQSDIVQVAMRLAEQGQIVIGRGGGEDQFV